MQRSSGAVALPPSVCRHRDTAAPAGAPGPLGGTPRRRVHAACPAPTGTVHVPHMQGRTGSSWGPCSCRRSAAGTRTRARAAAEPAARAAPASHLRLAPAEAPWRLPHSVVAAAVAAASAQDGGAAQRSRGACEAGQGVHRGAGGRAQRSRGIYRKRGSRGMHQGACCGQKSACKCVNEAPRAWPRRVSGPANGRGSSGSGSVAASRRLLLPAGSACRSGARGRAGGAARGLPVWVHDGQGALEAARQRVSHAPQRLL